jgi:hypothetical protein
LMEGYTHTTPLEMTKSGSGVECLRFCVTVVVLARRLPPFILRCFEEVK